jgi:hypothetical protein
MRLIKRFFLATGWVILQLAQPLIPAKNPNSLNFYGPEGVCIFKLDGRPRGEFSSGGIFLEIFWGLAYYMYFFVPNL